jgi:hypothetical protein
MSEAIDITSNGRSHGRLTGPIFLRAVDQWHLLEFHSARSKGRSITVEPLTWRGLVTYNVRFFIHLESQPISIAGITDRPEACWMRQVAGHATLEGMGHLNIPARPHPERGRSSNRLSLRVARSRCQVLP